MRLGGRNDAVHARAQFAQTARLTRARPTVLLARLRRSPRAPDTRVDGSAPGAASQDGDTHSYQNTFDTGAGAYTNHNAPLVANSTEFC